MLICPQCEYYLGILLKMWAYGPTLEILNGTPELEFLAHFTGDYDAC